MTFLSVLFVMSPSWGAGASQEFRLAFGGATNILSIQADIMVPDLELGIACADTWSQGGALACSKLRCVRQADVSWMKDFPERDLHHHKVGHLPLT